METISLFRKFFKSFCIFSGLFAVVLVAGPVEAQDEIPLPEYQQCCCLSSWCSYQDIGDGVLDKKCKLKIQECFLVSPPDMEISQADTMASDDDGDGICNFCDNCPQTANGIDVKPTGSSDEDLEDSVQADTDKDMVGDACDNCDSVWNPDQAGPEGDETGDACNEQCPEGQTPANQTVGQNKTVAGAGCQTNPSLTGAEPTPFTLMAVLGIFLGTFLILSRRRSLKKIRAPRGFKSLAILMGAMGIFFLSGSVQAQERIEGPGDGDYEIEKCCCPSFHCKWEYVENDNGGEWKKDCRARIGRNYIENRDDSVEGEGGRHHQCYPIQMEGETRPEGVEYDGVYKTDTDGDGICDDCDNCPEDPNGLLPPEPKWDTCEAGGNCECDSAAGDGEGDCGGWEPPEPDPTDDDQADMDGDMVGDACDNCKINVNMDQADGDGNGVGDACEPLVCEEIPPPPPPAQPSEPVVEGQAQSSNGISGSGCLSSLMGAVPIGFSLGYGVALFPLGIFFLFLRRRRS